jgi:predicted SnoaL-like aldol condensation-catalyzing enzyme
MNPKELVLKYYEQDALRNPEMMDKYLHKDFLLQWHSSKGYLEADKKDVISLAAEMAKSYTSSRTEIVSIVHEGNEVAVRYIYYVTAFENPGEEMILAHFAVFWQIQDGLLYRGRLMSQL